MEGKLVEISRGYYRVDCDGVIYAIPIPKMLFRSKYDAKVGDKVILNDDSLSIINIIHES